MSVRILGIAIFLLASWGIGGPILGLPAIALLIWLWKRGQTNNFIRNIDRMTEEAKIKNEEISKLLDESFSRLELDLSEDNSEKEINKWPPELIAACSKFSHHAYYIGDLIPEKKRVAAMEKYPLPGNTEVLALIDGTVFGSAARGLAVGRDGIAWKDFGKENPVQMTWDFLAQRQIALSGRKVSIGLLEYEGTGSGIDPKKLETLFASLHEYAQSVSALGLKQSQRHVDVPRKSPVVVDAAKPVIAVNSADFDELLALPGIGAAEAQMIIKRRSEQAFTSNVELADYLDLKPHIATRLDGATVFEPTSAAPQVPKAERTLAVSNLSKPSPLGSRTID